jgi:hypothetical protein
VIATAPASIQGASQRSEKILRILDKRKPLLSRLEATQQDLERFQSILEAFQGQRTELLQQPQLLALQDALNSLNLRSVQQDITEELTALDRLNHRFSRKTLNIGVVGRARQGKSRLLQSLTGLTAQEIPDGGGAHCTGVRSTISHRPEQKTEATVLFYDEKSFLADRLSPYYRQLELGACPLTVNHFANSPLPKLPAHKTDAVSASQYEHLLRYKEKLVDYQQLIGHAPRQIEADKIREYVAQDTPDGERIYSNYLAVKEVQIYCDFPNPDVGQISVIDMPGLGDTAIGDEMRMLETLGKDVDFVLFVRKPNPGADVWYKEDVQLYTTATKALIDLPIDQWSFMVLNRTENLKGEGDNSRQCQLMEQDILNKKIRVSRTIVANCIKPEQANELVLDPILEYMLEHIARLDEQYASACQQRVNSIRSAIHGILQQASGIVRMMPDDGDDVEIFREQFKRFRQSLVKGLRDMLDRLQEQRLEPDPYFAKEVTQVLSECHTFPPLPTSERIVLLQEELMVWPGTQGRLMHETRNKLSKAFFPIERGLELCIDQVKQEIYQVLVKQASFAALAPDHQGGAFLKQIAQLIEEKKGRNNLYAAFKLIGGFELLYRGLVQHRIRQHLDVLTPDLTPFQYNRDPESEMPKGHPFDILFPWTMPQEVRPLIEAEQVADNLKRAYEQALSGCEQELNDLLAEPSQAAFAIAEEFVDQILLAEDAEDELYSFLYSQRKTVWPDAFNKNAQLRGVARSWKDAVEILAKESEELAWQFVR